MKNTGTGIDRRVRRSPFNERDVDRESYSGLRLDGTFKAIPVVTGGELIISRLVFTRFVLMSAHTKKIDANKHMTANKPV